MHANLEQSPKRGPRRRSHACKSGKPRTFRLPHSSIGHEGGESRAASAASASATRSTVVARFSSVVRAVRRRTAAPQPAHTRLRGSCTHARERRTTAAAPNASLARPLSRLRVAAALSQHAVVPTAHETNAPSPQATDHDQCHQQPKCGYKSKHEQGRSANDCSYDRR